MTWVRIDDGFFRHPKNLALTPKAQLLKVACLCYCAANLTDGRIPAPAVPLILAEARCSKAQWRELVTHGTLVENGNEYQIHDFLEYNRSRAEVEKERARWRRNKRDYRAAQDDESDEVSAGMSAVDTTEESAAPRPVPSRPVPLGTGSKGSSSSHRETDDDETVDNYELVAGHLAKLKTDAAKPESPKRYMAAVRKNIDVEDGDEIRRLLDGFPTAPVTVVAAAVLTGDTRHLAPYA